jgi:hypothetical protein
LFIVFLLSDIMDGCICICTNMLVTFVVFNSVSQVTSLLKFCKFITSTFIYYIYVILLLFVLRAYVLVVNMYYVNDDCCSDLTDL